MPGRLARVVANPTTPLSFKHRERHRIPRHLRDAAASTIPGSMRGRPISHRRHLRRCSGPHAGTLLGQGGNPWLYHPRLEGRAIPREMAGCWPPRRPRPSERPAPHHLQIRRQRPGVGCGDNLGLMMKEGLLKENIDGEALEWAHRRLNARPEAAQDFDGDFSDGAPVDDSDLVGQLCQFSGKTPARCDCHGGTPQARSS